MSSFLERNPSLARRVRNNYFAARPATCRLFELLDYGVVSPDDVVNMCLSYMSEADVADMVDYNELSEDFL